MLVSSTSGVCARMTAWADSRYGMESAWKILGERSVAVLLSPLNKREVLKTPYIQIWCRCGYISALTDRGIDVFSSISVNCLYPLHIYIYTIQYNTKYFIPSYTNNLHRIVME